MTPKTPASIARKILPLFVLLLAVPAGLRAQEAGSGFSLGATLSGETVYSQELYEAPRDGSAVIPAFRAVLYPTWKISDHWIFTGAVQAWSVPYFYYYFSTGGHSVDVNLLQANLSYSRFWGNKSLVVKVGQMPSAFGSYPLRYDDMSNPLVDVPLPYGYAIQGITVFGQAGAEVDTSINKFDMRLQFTNASPLNPLSLFGPGQYGDWTFGGGYTITQGFRVGASFERGPYTNTGGDYAGYLGAGNPLNLPGTAVGVDVEWGRGPLQAYGEWQHVQMDEYEAAPMIQNAEYGELRWTLNPRWYAATRIGFSQTVNGPGAQSYEAAIGFRPAGRELIKLDYELGQGIINPGVWTNTVAVQFVASLHAFSIAPASHY